MELNLPPYVWTMLLTFFLFYNPQVKKGAREKVAKIRFICLAISLFVSSNNKFVKHIL